MSRLTSLVAIDVTKSRPDSENLVSKEMPTNLPNGWEFGIVFGDQGNSESLQKTRSLRKTSFQRVAQLVAPAPSATMAAQVAKSTRSVTLPQTATASERNIILGAMLLLLAGFLTIISSMWQRVANLSRAQSTTINARDFHKMPW